MKVTQQVHKGYTERKEARKRGTPIRQIFGKHQFIFESELGKISLIELKNYGFEREEDVWEIYSLRGNLFEDVERFDTKEEAENKALKYLTIK